MRSYHFRNLHEAQSIRSIRLRQGYGVTKGAGSEGARKNFEMRNAECGMRKSERLRLRGRGKIISRNRCSNKRGRVERGETKRRARSKEEFRNAERETRNATSEMVVSTNA